MASSINWAPIFNPYRDTSATSQNTSQSKPTTPLPLSQWGKQVWTNVATIPQSFAKLPAAIHLPGLHSPSLSKFSPEVIAAKNRELYGRRPLGINELNYTDWLTVTSDPVASARLYYKYYSPVGNPLPTEQKTPEGTPATVNVVA